MKDIKIGMIGLDTSHAVAFTRLLNDVNEPFHVQGGPVVVAFPGGSPYIDLSMSRLEKFTNELKVTYQIPMVKSLESVAETSDAILLESVDGGQHLEQLEKIISYRKPIFIDKPFALNSNDAGTMIALSKKYGTPIMSSSALRFAENLQAALQDTTKGKIIGADCFGPMVVEESQPGFFWYGIHTIEMLFSILGSGAEKITTSSHHGADLITAVWRDGRIGTVRGNQTTNQQFGALIHFEKGSKFVDISQNTKPYYASLLEAIIQFFNSNSPAVSPKETKELIHFIELANISRQTGKTLTLQ